MKYCLIVSIAIIKGFLVGFAETDILYSTETDQALLVEGYEKLRSGKSNEALNAFEKVFQQDANNSDARFGQAIVFAEQERHKDAFAAYDWLIQQNPHHADAWNGRGLAAFNMGDFDEALASFKMSIADQPTNGFFYEALAWTQMCRGEFAEAAEWAKKALLMYQRRNETPLYPLLIAYFSYHESGDAENALRVLRYANQNRPSNKWPTQVIDYLNGKIDEAALISFVSNLSEETEARTYIGLHMRSFGQTEKAKLHLNWVGHNGDSKVFEYTLARTLVLQNGVVLLER